MKNVGETCKLKVYECRQCLVDTLCLDESLQMFPKACVELIIFFDSKLENKRSLTSINN